MVSMTWDSGQIDRNIEILKTKTHVAITAAFEVQAARSTGYLKTMAPWHDDTGAARAGLHATSFPEARAWELVLAHAVSYGIWLEVANHGKYQIILPALRQAMTELQGLINGLWGRI